MFERKNKRYFATRSANDLTKYAKQVSKKPKKTTEDIISRIKESALEDPLLLNGSYQNQNNINVDIDAHDYSEGDLIICNETNNPKECNDDCMLETTDETLSQFNNLLSGLYLQRNLNSDFEECVEDSTISYNILDPDDDEVVIPTIEKVKSFEELLASKDFYDNITTTTVVSPGELLLMILRFCKSSHLSCSGMSSLITLINSIFEKPVLPQSRYKLDEIFNQYDNVDFHATCPTCTGYLGKIESTQKNATCQVCKKNIDVSSCENTFVIMNPSTAVTELLQVHEEYYDFVVKERNQDENKIRDIYDGKMYREFVDSLPAEDRHNYFTTILNTDGASPFKSSQSSVWPIYLMVNEIPPQDRFNNLVPCGLWFSKRKPNMMIFIDPFVDKMNSLENEKITCRIKGEDRKLKGLTVVSSLDVIARAPVQGIKQFNGKYGCNWCLHKGEWIGSMKYPFVDYTIPDRDLELTKKCMRLSVEQEDYEPIYGVKHISPLYNLKKFHLIKGFIVEYMHCCLVGVGKQITGLLLKVGNVDVSFFTPLFQKIKCPHQISRLTRALSDSKHWKCREWENWILYYSTPLLSLKLKPKYIKYWALFVESLYIYIYILLQTEISSVELEQARSMLYTFVCKTQKYFGKISMTYNLHQLLHLVESVINWGPLWAHSAFSFEAGNHELLQAIHCARGAHLQILRYININRSINILEKSVYANASDAVQRYVRYTLKCQARKSIKFDKAMYFGKGCAIDENIINKFSLSATSTSYKRMVKQSCLYASCLKINARSDNSFAQLNDGRFIMINQFIVNATDNTEFTVFHQINVAKNELSNKYNVLRKIVNIEKNVDIIETACIKVICIHMPVGENTYICPLPNQFFY